MNKYIDYAKAFGSSDEVINWIEKVLKKHLSTNPENQSEIEHIIDYLSYPKTTEKLEIKGMSYAEAKKNTEKWSKSLQKKGRGIKETEKDTEVVLDFNDGFKIVKLIGKNAYDREGAIMGHCVASYYGNGKEIYSLRDKDNIPHCTMEKNQQVKGRGNGDIHPKYVGYVVKFLEHVGMTVGDNEMKHLGYVNVEDIIKKEPDLIFPELYNGKYFNEKLLPKVENKDRISLWGKFKLFTFGSNMEVEFNFDTEKSRTNLIDKLNSKSFIEKLKDKIINKKDNNKVAMTSYNKVAMTDSNKVAMTSYNKVAMTDNNKVAMTDNNEVAMTYNNEVAMTSYNKVAMTDNNEVAMTDNNVVCGLYNNQVEFKERTIVVLGNDSKVKGSIGSWFVLYERDNNNEIMNAVTKRIDGKKIKEDTWYKLEKGKLVEVK